jgi:hypothetical protein
MSGDKQVEKTLRELYRAVERVKDPTLRVRFRKLANQLAPETGAINIRAVTDLLRIIRNLNR